MKSKGSQQNRLLRIITFPARALGKAVNFYVRSITSCSDHLGQGPLVMGMPASSYAASLPRSFSVNSSASDDNDDLRELIRAASARTSADRIDINSLYLQQLIMKQQTSNLVAGPKSLPPRSCSVGMGRIDEENPSVFGEDNTTTVKPEDVYPRSRSHAVNRRSVFFWSYVLIFLHESGTNQSNEMFHSSIFIRRGFLFIWNSFSYSPFPLFVGFFFFSIPCPAFLIFLSGLVVCTGYVKVIICQRKGFISKFPNFSHSWPMKIFFLMYFLL